MLQIVDVFLCRSSVCTAFTREAFAPLRILWGEALELVMPMTAVYTPLGTASVPTVPWAFLVPFAVVMMAAEEACKAAVRLRLPVSAKGPSRSR